MSGKSGVRKVQPEAMAGRQESFGPHLVEVLREAVSVDADVAVLWIPADAARAAKTYFVSWWKPWLRFTRARQSFMLDVATCSTAGGRATRIPICPSIAGASTSHGPSPCCRKGP